MTNIFNAALNWQINSQFMTVEYISRKSEILYSLISGLVSLYSQSLLFSVVEYFIFNQFSSVQTIFIIVVSYCYLFRYEQKGIALYCGNMLIECSRYEILAKIILNSNQFFNFFRYIESSIESDAFHTFKVFNGYNLNFFFVQNSLKWTNWLMRCSWNKFQLIVQY